MVTALTEKLKNGKKAGEVEAALNELHPLETDKENFASLARSLLFNLKNNAALRKKVLSGTLSAFDLVRLAPDEMACQEKLLQDEKDREGNTVARGDLEKILKEEFGCEPDKPQEAEAFRDY